MKGLRPFYLNHNTMNYFSAPGALAKKEVLTVELLCQEIDKFFSKEITPGVITAVAAASAVKSGLMGWDDAKNTYGGCSVYLSNGKQLDLSADVAAVSELIKTLKTRPDAVVELVERYYAGVPIVANRKEKELYKYYFIYTLFRWTDAQIGKLLGKNRTTITVGRHKAPKLYESQVPKLNSILNIKYDTTPQLMHGQPVGV